MPFSSPHSELLLFLTALFLDLSYLKEARGIGSKWGKYEHKVWRGSMTWKIIGENGGHMEKPVYK